MKNRFAAILAVCLCLMALPLAIQAQYTPTAQAGVSFWTQTSATATATSNPIRLPAFSGNGTLTISETGITGSPSGCTVTLAYQGNNATAASSTVATVSFTPANGVQTFAISPNVFSGDQYVATYACSSTYPTAGILTAASVRSRLSAPIRALLHKNRAQQFPLPAQPQRSLLP